MIKKLYIVRSYKGILYFLNKYKSFCIYLGLRNIYFIINDD